MLRERGHNGRVALDEQHDAVGNLEAGLLARVLHGAHELAREPLAAQRVVERRVEPDEIAALLGAGETLRPTALSTSKSAGSIASAWPSTTNVCASPRATAAAIAAPSAVARYCANRRNQLAVALADDGQVRLDAIADERRVARDQLEPLDVELVQDLVLVAAHGGLGSRVRHADQEARERLADLELRRVARGAAETHDALHDVGLGEQLAVEPRGVGLGPLRHVHADGRTRARSLARGSDGRPR